MLCRRFEYGLWHGFALSQVGLSALLLLEEKGGLTVLLNTVLFSLIPHLVVNCDLVFCHLDVLLNDADLFLLFWSLKAEIGWIITFSSL